MSNLFEISKSVFSIFGQVWSGTRSKSSDQSPAPLIPTDNTSLVDDISAAAEGSDFGLGDVLGGFNFD